MTEDRNEYFNNYKEALKKFPEVNIEEEKRKKQKEAIEVCLDVLRMYDVRCPHCGEKL